MAFDLNRTRYFLTKEVPVAPGASIPVEGAVLKQVRVNGLENAALTAGDSTSEAIIGFSVNNDIVPGTEIVTETVVVPASGIVQLKHGNLQTGTVWVYNTTDAASLAVVLSGNPTSVQVLAGLVAGQLTFNAAALGDTVQVRYRYALTALEQEMKYGGRPVNMRANTAQGTITYIRGFGELYTDQYDTTVDFSAATTLYADANGLVTTTSSGKTAIPGARVVSLPTAADPFLGISFNLA